MIEAFLAFLLSFMPAGDKADYSEDFFRGNVQQAVEARAEAAWTVPDDIFMHFVLPVRVNNENLDSARWVLRKELSPRIHGMSMSDAVLEVNHWCHEHVTYQPSDARTSSPLATIRTAWGRCGEESTLLVAALRSVCIPARQVYTPRWAHTDDNHAWVEAWVDGQWCFLGACEPEPVLNLGWFNAPASRGMLMHTKVFGDYHGPEDVMSRTHQFTEINVIDNYAPSARATVRVANQDGLLIDDATIEWKIYNYAEFYTVSRQEHVSSSTLTAGLGDMLVMAYRGTEWGFAKVRFGQDTLLTVVLDHTIGEVVEEDLDIVPPAEHANMPWVTSDMRAANDRRLAYEDSLRLSYRATFPSAEELAAQGYSEVVQHLIIASEGNHASIIRFLNKAKEVSLYDRAVVLLQTLSDKDLRDAEEAVLTDHLMHTPINADADHVLCPRVAYERLTPWRSELAKRLDKKLVKQWIKNPEKLVSWCRKNIAVRNDWTIGGTYTSPIGVGFTRIADSRSLPVFFVAVCRTLGIPAWQDKVTGNVFYEHKGKTMLAQLEPGQDREFRTALLTLDYTPQTYLQDPEYYRHMSLSRYDHEQFFLMEYDDFLPISDSFAKGEEVETGYYLLVSGQRLADGSALVHLSAFPVEQDTHHTLVVRQDEEAVSVIGSFDSESRYETLDGKQTSVLQTTGRGYFAVGILGVGQEPTNHALRDIVLARESLQAWGRTILLIFQSRQDYDHYMASPIEGLPDNVVFGIDTDGSLTNSLREGMHLDAQAPLPYFIIGDTFNRVVWHSHGYTIGIGEQLKKILKLL